MKWYSIRPLLKKGRVFNIVIGGRGTGKTFNSIRELTEDGLNFIYMRRTFDECTLIADHADDMNFSPFQKINNVTGKSEKMETRTYEIKKSNKKIWNIYDGIGDLQHFVGALCSLSTINSVRGFDADWCKAIILDEFIPEKHVKKIGKGDSEGEAILNAYETINRNRELEGEPPCLMFMFSNAFDISHPFLDILGLTPIIERMKRKGTQFVDLPQKNLTITVYEDKEFMEAKSKTALYQLTRGSSFYEMALNNDFVYNDFSLVRSKNISEYNPYVIFDGIEIYKHKSNGSYYCSLCLKQCNNIYHDVDNERTEFVIKYGRILYAAFIKGNIFFENYAIKKKIMEVIA